MHGVTWQGPCQSLEQAGCKGKYASNIQRDILRKVFKKDPNQVSQGTNSLYVLGTLDVFQVWGWVPGPWR